MEQEGLETNATTTMEEFVSKYNKEFSLVTVVSSVDSGGFGGDFRWIVDSGSGEYFLSSLRQVLND
jgi:hypothetical protein